MTHRDIILLKRDAILSDHKLPALAVERTPDDADSARDAAARELTVRLSNADAALLRDINSALARIDAGEFGDCLDCGSPIPLKRLAAVPWAPRCVPCQQQAEAQARNKADALQWEVA
jgi:DnaK suppressor protein